MQPLVLEVRQARQELGDAREELGRERARREATEQRLQALERQGRGESRDQDQRRWPWWVRLLRGR